MSTSVRAEQPADLTEPATGSMVDPLIRLANGKAAPGLMATGVNEANEYAGDFLNAGIGTKSFRARAGAAYARVENGTVLLGGPTTIDGDASVTGLLTASNLQVNADANINDDLTVGDITTTNTLSVTLNAAVGQDLAVTRDLSVGRNTALGDATTDALTALATSTWRSATATETALFVDTTTTAQAVRMGPAATPTVTVNTSGRLVTLGATGAGAVLYADIPNNRVILGGSTALSSAADDKLSVVGGALHIASTTAETALGIRHTAAGEAWVIGAHAATNPNLVFNESATDIVIFGALGATYQLDVNGNARVDGDLTVTGDITGGNLTFTDLELSGTLEVDGATTLNAAVTVTAGGIGVTGSSAFSGAVSFVSGGIAHIAGNIGVFNATPVAKQTVTGSRGGNAALASVLTALATFGWITDSSS